MGLFGEAWDKVEEGAGDLVSDGSKVLGSGLNDVGLHGAARTVETVGDKLGASLGGNVGELQLGESGDPKDLVHGNAGTLAATAGKLKAFGTGFAEAADGLHRIDTGHWEGAAADAFRAKFAPEPAKWADAAEAMGQASAALESYAETVSSAQSRAGQAIDLWNRGQEATKQAQAAYNQQVSAYNSAANAYNAAARAGQNPGTEPARPGAFSDPGEALRREAQQVLAEARQDRDSAAASAAAAVRQATALAPKEPSLLNQLKDDATDAYGAGQFASVSTLTGVVDGAADIVKFGRTLDPFDPWNSRHLAEYASGVNGTLAGLADMEVNPAGAVKGLLGSGWGSDPFQAFGKLVPNIALTAVSGGGGAAADAGDALDAASALTEDDPALNAASREAEKIPGKGDPVDPVTGDVLLRQADVSLPGALPLTVRRVHRSSQRAGRWFGEAWASTLDQRLVVMADRITCVLDGGQVLVYRRSDLDGTGSSALPVAGPSWPLTALGDDVHEVTDPQQGLTWRFEPHPAYWRFARGLGEFPLVSVRDRAGHVITVEYGLAGEPAALVHSGGYRVDVAMDGSRVTGLSLGGTPLASYSYDENGALTGISDSSGRPLAHRYDEAGRVRGYTERGGSSYEYAYDERGRCIRGESPSGAMNGTYSYRNGATVWTDGTGAAHVYDIDASARITADTDPLGNVTRYSHDDRGRVIAETDPLDRVIRYEFDDAGNLLAVVRPDGETARAVYDEHGQPAELDEPGRGVTRQEFDAAGNRTVLRQPDGTEIRYAYDRANHLARVTGADGGVTQVRCDALGLPSAVTGPEGATTRYERNPLGQVVKVTDPAGATVTMTWSAEGRPLTRTFPGGSTETWTWDPDGNLAGHVSPGGAATFTEYGPFAAVTAMTGPDGVRAELSYDGEMRLTSVTRAGLTWTYERDAAGRLTAETDFNSAVTRYELDAAGQVTRRVNAAGQAVACAFDALGNLTAQTAETEAGAASGDVTTFEYDTAGDLIRARNSDADVVLTRDALGRILSESVNGHAVTTTYDPAGRVVGRFTPSGAGSVWSYDRAGLPQSLGTGGQLVRFGHRLDGREATRDLPGGVHLSQDWDLLGRLTGQTLTGPESAPGSPDILQRRRYAYTPDGYVTGLTDLIAGTRAFGLDPAGRVTAVTGAEADGAGTEWTEQYSYAPTGAIASAAWPALPEAASGGWLDATAQGARTVTGTLTRQAGNVRYRHDRAGRVTQRTRTRLSRKPETWHYQWDPDDRLTAVTTPDGTTWRYRYDPLGRRILKQQVTAAGTVRSETRFAWDGLVLAEQAELLPGDPEPEVPPAPGGKLSWTSAPPPEPSRERVTTWDYRPGTFTPVAQSVRTIAADAPQDAFDAEFYSIVTDLAGSPAELIDADGTIAGIRKQTLWGGTYWHPDGAQTPLGFPGQYADPETGLSQNGHRYYDPATGTYLSPDPLGLAPSPNPHAYVSNPHVLTDPLGLMADSNYNVRVSPMASDWATKGAHVHVGDGEVSIVPDHEGGITAKPIRLAHGTATPSQVQRALEALKNSPQLREDLIAKAEAARQEIAAHNWGNTSSRGKELTFLIRNLRNMK